MTPALSWTFWHTFRSTMPDFNFTTDIIVGFSWRNREDFAETLRMAREALSAIHTFRYSRRKGTRADRLEDQVAEQIKSERSERNPVAHPKITDSNICIL